MSLGFQPLSARLFLRKDMENLDPKAVFANERTLLHYAEKGMQLASKSMQLKVKSDCFKPLKPSHKLQWSLWSTVNGF